jgi:signal transduction histidine kinase
VKSYYYIYNSSLSGYLPKTQNTFIKKLAKERGGIRVYRNGFRVLPYGEQFDDWLKLEEATARRRILPPFRRENFFGFVELIDITSQVFEETSSREGLIENDAFRELVVFVSRVLESAVLRVAEERGRKQRPTSSSDVPPTRRLRRSAKDAQKLTNSLRNRIDKVRSSDDPADEIDTEELQEIVQDFQVVVDAINAAIEEEEVREAQFLEELGMLRILASLGLSIGEFTHEIRHHLGALTAGANQLRAFNTTGKPRAVADAFVQTLGDFKTYATYFDQAVIENVRRDMRPQEIGKVLRAFHKVILPALGKYGINMPEPKIHGYDLFTVPMHPSEWTSILFNLFTNSIKAIKRAENSGKIQIQAGEDGNILYIGFSDNGDGIAPENASRIFDAFFTTTSPASPFDNNQEQDELLGSGLGLKIVKDIVTSYRGDIRLAEAPEGYVTCFRITIPAASKDELENYAY